MVINDIRAEAAQAVADEVRAAGGQAIANTGDITTLAGAQSILDATLAAFGDVHVLVNNAGVLRDRMFLSLSEEDWDTVMRVHLRGHFCMGNTFGRYWRDRKKAGHAVDARIINTSSGAGLQGSIGQSNYVAAKGGIAALTLVQAAELGRYGITVNSLAPAARTALPKRNGAPEGAPKRLPMIVGSISRSSTSRTRPDAGSSRSASALPT